MKFSNRLGQVLALNVIVWLIYLADSNRGYPWPIWVTIGSISVFLKFK